MKCVDKCSFLIKQKGGDSWYCDLYNQNLSEKDGIFYTCDECYIKEINSLKEQLSSIYKIEDIIRRM